LVKTKGDKLDIKKLFIFFFFSLSINASKYSISYILNDDQVLKRIPGSIIPELENFSKIFHRKIEAQSPLAWQISTIQSAIHNYLQQHSLRISTLPLSECFHFLQFASFFAHKNEYARSNEFLEKAVTEYMNFIGPHWDLKELDNEFSRSLLNDAFATPALSALIGILHNFLIRDMAVTLFQSNKKELLKKEE